MKVSFQLDIHVGTKGRKQALDLDIVIHALVQHFGEDVDGFLSADIAFLHDAEHKVLVIAVRLFFLRQNKQFSLINIVSLTLKE
jgi:hypothetical protein